MCDEDSLDLTYDGDDTDRDATDRDNYDPPPGALARIGRYRVVKMLGKGSFGLVYLAHDELLDRQVAVKVPHAHLIASPKNAEEYLNEARTVARLDHPGIVPVHDVGGTDECPCFIVSKYIEGSDLAAKRESYRGKFTEIAELVATVAEALHYAHKQGLVHRDVKPSNILIGRFSKPYVVDFGLAMNEENVGKGPRYVGTPAYMSPEQARGEGHRVDGRSDIYSLGVVLYELLTGRRTLTGRTKSDILMQIATQEPKPPRQIDDAIPKDLERICLKALSRRALDRFTTALDFAEELWNVVLDGHTEPAPASTVNYNSDVHLSPSARESASLPLSESTRMLRVVPKGLRSFDEHDADFFLELLPGPRDRHGLPSSIRFWKSHIDETEADKTFSVGLVYGPSGCGKSSLFKAGLLPRLAGHVEPVYIECTADDTEARLLHRLRKQCPLLPDSLSLKDSLATLRRADDCPPGRKILIVLDQFEQWLHSNKANASAELVQALRQCDGANVQCILMVRDDFWMAATRFTRELEVQLLEGHNLAAVDLFPLRHAREVLSAFGRAFGALSEAPQKLSKPQQLFLEHAIAGMAEDDKVVCVRLALFAEMMKGKSWEASVLDEMGGTKGVGVRFLDETFQSPTASPTHRLHYAALCNVLKALLPTSATSIKGEMKSYQQLLDASGYTGRPQDFQTLIRILDSEVRLITPTDPAGLVSDDLPQSTGEAGQPRDEEHAGEEEQAREAVSQRYYQLTHDYLVPSLHEWLTRHQRSTRRGRAELILDERAASWNMKPETRQLPSLWEYVSIVLLTSPKHWTQAQSQMMSVASRLYGGRCAAGSLMSILLVAALLLVSHQFRQSQEQLRANGFVDQLLVADTTELPTIVQHLEDSWRYSLPRLNQLADDLSLPRVSRLRAAYVLAPNSNDRANQLIVDGALEADLELFHLIRQRLGSAAKALAPALWKVVQTDQSTPTSQLRAAALLAVADPKGSAWESSAPVVVKALLSENTLFLDQWIEFLEPAAAALTPHWSLCLSDKSAMANEHATAARALARFADASMLCEQMLQSDHDQCAMLFPGTTRQEEAVTLKLRKVVGELTSRRLDADARRKLRNATIVLLRLGQFDDVAKVLSATSDPTVRTMVMLELRNFAVDPETLLKAYQAFGDPVARQAVLLALGAYHVRDLSSSTQRRLDEQLKDLMRHSHHAAERSAAERILRSRGGSSWVDTLNDELLPSVETLTSAELDNRLNRPWWLTAEGHTMIRIPASIAWTLGSPEDETGREAGESLKSVTLPRAVAVSAHEVTVEQFVKFRPQAEFSFDVSATKQLPAHKVSLIDAMRYCRWLSEQEKISESEMCYDPCDEITDNDYYLSSEQLQRTGYRLPTDEEWECVCRAGSTTPWLMGREEAFLSKFGWYILNSDSQLHPVGSLMPNAWGLFDTAGNVSEWCHPTSRDQNYIIKGGNFQSLSIALRSARRPLQSITGYSFTGFRIARTCARK